ncbi:MAG TPA: hypothetical protein VF142_02345 [Longimicrobium sp.]
MRLSNRSSALLLLALAACTDKPENGVTPPTPEPDPKGMEVVGLYRLEVTGISGGEPTSAVLPADGPSEVLTPVSAGLVFEQTSSTTFTEGARGKGGQRYVSFTYRVRNSTGAPLNNLTILLVSKSSGPATIAGTPISSLRLFNGTNANPAIASQIVPTGAVAMGSDLVTMQARYPDVLQALTEAEVAAIAPPPGVTSIFPVGYVVRHRTSVTDRLLPATSDPNQFDGVLTVAFRLPMQAGAAQDPFSLFFEILAVTDSETRLTESIEESQDTAAVRRLRDRATALGATTVTVLDGSPAMDPAVPDYPGQRQICSARTAGTAASPTTFINRPAAYTRLALLYPGETMSACGAYFRTGTPGRPATNVQFPVTVKAVDLYGNVDTTAVDTVHLTQLSGPPATMGFTLPLVNGSRILTVTYSDYGTSQLAAVGRRNEGRRPVPVAGVTRTWEGDVSTDWHTNGNWSPAAVPMSLDSVYIPVAAPVDPVLSANVSIAGVHVEDIATIHINAFNLDASANVFTGTTGGITNTVGRVNLTGTAKEVQGRLPYVTVTGTYSLSANLTTRASLRVQGGRLRSTGFRIRTESF